MKESTIFLQLPAKKSFLPAIGQFVKNLFAAFEELGDKEQLRYDLELIVSEACTNVIRHAYPSQDNPGILQLKICYHPKKIQIEIVDFGPGFDPQEIEEPNFDDPREGGMGLFIIRQLSDRIEYQSQAQGNVLRLEKDF